MDQGCIFGIEYGPTSLSFSEKEKLVERIVWGRNYLEATGDYWRRRLGEDSSEANWNWHSNLRVTVDWTAESSSAEQKATREQRRSDDRRLKREGIGRDYI
ncbi:unnamed protein product [Linum trigynum]|uniref:Cellulase n=1 Tax=Linum trigynum TaxID=586398 RepID=A0AAV2CFA9_9ROSI